MRDSSIAVWPVWAKLCLILLLFGTLSDGLRMRSRVLAAPPDRFVFRLPTLEGEAVDTADLRGSVVLLNFFATWCAPCAKEMPFLQRLSDVYRAQGLVVLGMALDRPGIMGLSKTLDLHQHLRRYVEKLQISYPILLASKAITMSKGKMVIEAYGGVSGLPATFILDRNGELRETIIGYRQEAQFEQLVRRVLAY